jgi:hypothetical protein
MSFGFVYIMTNPEMDAFKIGCTERAPHARASELSASTAVPAPFRVVCYAEFADCQSIERQLHDHFGKDRVSPSREFFYPNCIFDAIAYLYWHPSQYAFCDVCCNEYICHAHDELDDLDNPWPQAGEA